MSAEIDQSRQILENYLNRKRSGLAPLVDRAEVVSHATLSAFIHHWPSRAEAPLQALIEATAEIRERERSRWMTQRRIAIAKLARELGTLKTSSEIGVRS